MTTIAPLSLCHRLAILVLFAVASCQQAPRDATDGANVAHPISVDSIRLWDSDRRGLPDQILSAIDSLFVGLDTIPSGEYYTYALYIRGKSLFKIGAYEESVQTMAGVIQRNSTNTEIARNARLLAAHGLRACNDTLGALALYQACLRYSNVIEQSRNADVLANIAMIERWLGRRDSAIIHARIARASFAQVGDTSGVEWTERIERGEAHNTVPHQRQTMAIHKLPVLRWELTFPHSDIVMDIAIDGYGMKWMATLAGLVRDIGFGVEWLHSVRIKVAQAFTDVVRETDSTIVAKTIRGQWVRVHVGTMQVSECPLPRIVRARIHADVPFSQPGDRSAHRKSIPTLPREIDAKLVTNILTQSDTSSIICLRDRGALLWEHRTNRVTRLFSYGTGWPAGILDVRDVFWSHDRWGAISVRGLAWERLSRSHNRTTLANTYRDGSSIHAYRFHPLSTSRTIIQCGDHTAMLIDSVVLRIPPKGIDTTMRWPDGSWLISGIRKNYSVTSTSISLHNEPIPEISADEIRLSPQTASDIAWLPIQYSIDKGKWRPLEATGWVDLRALDYGLHNIGIQWADGTSTSYFPVFSSARWWATWWGFAILTLSFALLLTLIVWYFMRRSMDRRLEQQRQIHDERARISRDLHDHVGSQLARMSTIASRIEHSTDPSHRTVLLKRLQQASREATRSLRDVLTVSQVGTTSLQDVIAVLRERLRELATDVEITFAFQIDNSIDRPLSGEQRHHLVMFVMEAVTNAVRHGESATITMILQQHNHHTELLLTDDGRGRSAQDRIGLGTSTMEHRAAILGASVAWEPGKLGGTTVRLRWR